MGQAQGRELPFDIGEKHSCLVGKTVWSAHDGRRKSDGEPVTVFVYDITGKTEDEIKLVRSAHLRLKTLHHPNILRYIDGVELPDRVYLVTEKVIPLEEHCSTSDGQSQFSTAWGLHQVLKGLSFLSNDCGLVHHNVNLSSIFVDTAGEWKLGGVEFMTPFAESATANSSGKVLEGLRKYDPPEVSKPAASRRAEKWSADMWGLGCLLWEVFNGSLTQVSALRNTSKLPKSLVPHYMECVSANPRSRPNPSSLLSRLREHGRFLATPLISIALRIEELQIMEPSQRNEFFTELNSSLDSFPEAFSRCKILPQLINAFEFGGAGSAVLAPLFRLGRLLEEGEYQRRIVPCVVKLFSSTDRATRLNLLKQLEHFIDHLQPSTVSNQIFPHIASGFTDTVPALREQTVKSMLLIVPKLNDSVKNTQLLKCLAKCQLDEQPGIRTNTTICLSKIACHLSASTRHKVLVSAFLRPLKDPFPPARCAGIGAMATTHTYYTTSDIASRLLPALCSLTVDKEKTVRDQAFNAIKVFLRKLEKFSDDPEAAAQQEKEEAAVTTWTGWAVSSITSKLYKSGGASTASSASNTMRSSESKSGGASTASSASSTTRSSESKTAESQRPERQTEGAVGGDESVGGVQAGGRGGRGGEGEGREKDREEGQGAVEEGWDEEEWEDFNISADHAQTRDIGGGSGGGGMGMGEGGEEDGGMEEWEDDGWGTFETQEEDKNVSSSGADFFDTLEGNFPAKDESEDLFDRLGVGVGGGGKGGKKPSPPPVSANLFGSSMSGGGGGGGGEKAGKEDGGWGDWGDDFSSKATVQEPESRQKGHAMKLGSKPPSKEPSSKSSLSPVPTAASTASTGWDFDSEWGSFDTPSPSSPSSSEQRPQSSPSGDPGRAARQELMQKRQEERRQRQKAAREKRVAGVDLRPGGLGAVKKN